jgi:hypothetical protein
MIGIGISKPDMGSVIAVHPGIPLVKGLGPVLNIILAYSAYIHVAHVRLEAELKQQVTSPFCLSKPN